MEEDSPVEVSTPFFKKKSTRLIGIAAGIAAVTSIFGVAKNLHNNEQEIQNPYPDYNTSYVLTEQARHINSEWQKEAQLYLSGKVELPENETIHTNGEITFGKRKWEIDTTTRSNEVIGYSYPGVFTDKTDSQPTAKLKPGTKIPKYITMQGLNIVNESGETIPQEYAYFECEDIEGLTPIIPDLKEAAPICVVPAEFISSVNTAP